MAFAEGRHGEELSEAVAGHDGVPGACRSRPACGARRMFGTARVVFMKWVVACAARIASMV
ncbi:hypothetical protein AZ78_0125 [Lysobacter capsici AZ78]|uniref:Uncharacterized protein n=1 Tax=Lysobacter capsici AZ78 TaxID=1444315 RepID=A0A108U4U8_9GAMM|nr:hypothetical protein AZ78_0125 [Lysobacter capsici AZ78]